MLGECRMSDVLCEELMVADSRAISYLGLRASSSLRIPGSKPSVDKVSCVVGYDLGLAYFHTSPFPAPQSKDLFVEVIWKPLSPAANSFCR